MTINWDRVHELRDEVGPEDFDEVVTLFLEEVSEAMDRLRRPSDVTGLDADLHFIKGSALNLGFDALAGLCHQGERAAAEGRAGQVDLGEIVEAYTKSLADFSAGQENLSGAA